MIDGKEAKEYEIVTAEAENVVTCYIASQTGKEFTVLWENCSYLDHEICGDIYLDGVFSTGKVISDVEDEDLPQVVEAEGAVCNDGKSIRPFVFSALRLTDDDAFLGESSTDLGVIEISIYPVDGGEDGCPINDAILPELTVHEKAKKGMAQQVSLAAPKVLPDGEQCSSSVDPTRLGPDIVKFRFTYRPLEVLQADAIAPSPPKSKKRKRHPGTSNDEQAEREDPDVNARKAKELREQLAALESAEAKKIRVCLS
ncbi:hypothetical protein C8F01DRAFT_1181656 [Mycena amicta]|nr:hypothetical protein C8F01DRAFT_1181656 [Mycena amicta]